MQKYWSIHFKVNSRHCGSIGPILVLFFSSSSPRIERKISISCFVCHGHSCLRICYSSTSKTLKFTWNIFSKANRNTQGTQKGEGNNSPTTVMESRTRKAIDFKMTLVSKPCSFDSSHDCRLSETPVNSLNDSSTGHTTQKNTQKMKELDFYFMLRTEEQRNKCENLWHRWQRQQQQQHQRRRRREHKTSDNHLTLFVSSRSVKLREGQ